MTISLCSLIPCGDWRKMSDESPVDKKPQGHPRSCRTDARLAIRTIKDTRHKSPQVLLKIRAHAHAHFAFVHKRRLHPAERCRAEPLPPSWLPQRPRPGTRQPVLSGGASFHAPTGSNAVRSDHKVRSAMSMCLTRLDSMPDLADSLTVERRTT